MLLLGSTLLSTAIGLWIGIQGVEAQQPVRPGVAGACPVRHARVLARHHAADRLRGQGLDPGLFPTGGLSSPNTGFASPGGVADVARHLFLPCLTLTLAYIAEYALVMRSSLLDELTEDYLTTARAKGLRDALVLRRHAVPNGPLPTTTTLIFNLGFIVSGAITIETVYSWPGLGLLSYEALRTPDYPLLQGVFLLFSAAVIIANLVADLLYAYLVRA